MSPLTGAHTTFPVLDVPVAEFAKDKVGKVRNFVVITDEQIKNECQEPRQFVWFVDVTARRARCRCRPGACRSSGNFCSRGGRFGTHSSNENMTPIYYKRVMFFAHFNAGVRAVDIRDPYHPKEIAYYIPAITEATDKRCIKLERPGPLQDRDPDQQRGGRRARLYLYRRSRQHRHAHPRTDGSCAADRRASRKPRPDGPSRQAA